MIAGAITAHTGIVAQVIKRHLMERDAKIEALTKMVSERDSQVRRPTEHLQRLQTKVAVLELLAKGEKR